MSYLVVARESKARPHDDPGRPATLAGWTEMAVSNVKGTLFKSTFHARTRATKPLYPPPRAMEQFNVRAHEIVLLDVDHADRVAPLETKPENPVIPCFTSLNGFTERVRWAVMGVSQVNVDITNVEKQRFAVQTAGTATIHNRGRHVFRYGRMVLCYLPTQEEMGSHSVEQGGAKDKVLIHVKPLLTASVWSMMAQVAKHVRHVVRQQGSSKDYDAAVNSMSNFVDENDLCLVRDNQWCPIKAYGKLVAAEWTGKSAGNACKDALEHAFNVGRSFESDLSDTINDLEVGTVVGANASVNINTIDPAHMSYSEGTAFVVEMANAVISQRVLGRALSNAIPNGLLQIEILQRGV